MLQSVHESQILEKQIPQLFVEVICVWRDTDIKKNEAVKRLAARLEEYYHSARPVRRNTIQSVKKSLINLKQQD